jgi:type IV pilus assembly protein PilW
MMRARLTTAASPARAPRGFGLVEIMVALLISAFLVIGAITVFMQSRNTSRTADSAARMQETLRYALDTIEPDVRMARFWGLTNRNDAITNRSPLGNSGALDALVANRCTANWATDLDRYVDGRDGADTGGSGYDLDCAGTNPTSYSDVLIVRRASSRESVLTANRVQLQTTRTFGELFADGVRPASYDAPPRSATHDLVVNAYYVGAVDVPDGAPQQWALFRQELVAGAGGAGPRVQNVEIIRGIQDMQVEFGIDTNGDSSADRYVNPESAALAGAVIVAVRVWLLAVADDREPGFVNDAAFVLANMDHGSFGDDRRRVVMMKTIQLRNARA